MTTTEDWGRKVVAGNAAQSAFYALHGGRENDTAGPDTLYGVYDEDLGDFVAAFESQREAEDREAELERDEHDHGSRAWFPKYWPRYSVDQLPADHPLVDEVLA